VENDYIRLVKDYLRDVEYCRVAASNLHDSIKELEENLRDVSTKIASYEQNPGGNCELNAVEMESSRRIEQEQQLNDAVKNYQRLQNHLARVDRSLQCLTDEEQKALMYYYAERKSYLEIADRQNMSERSCRRMVREATRKMALMMFGLKSKENIIFVH
jgi:DNA-directed RNA polymerase specialized sigma24 family protein